MALLRSNRPFSRAAGRPALARLFFVIVSVCTASGLFSAVANAEGRYFYCRAMHEQRDTPCCHDHRSAESRSSVASVDCSCCEGRFRASPPPSAPTRGTETPPSPHVATLPVARVAALPRARGMALALRRNTGPPLAGVDRTKLMVFRN